VHRSHSGHYGIVNSEEGYQNLRRFLFGQIRVDALLSVAEMTLPAPIQKLKDEGKRVRASYHIECVAKVRGGNVNLHERRVDQESAIIKSYDELVDENARPVFLFSGFLDAGARSDAVADRALAFAVQVVVKVPLYEIDNRFWFDDHFEGADLFRETFTFMVRLHKEGSTVSYGLVSRHGPGKAPTRADLIPEEGGGSRIEIPIGFPEGAADRHPGKLRGTLILRGRWT
jgi:hypothetical protein